jgi:protein-disulfide isomerase
MSTSRVSRLVLPIDKRDHVRGPSDAAITLVEYGDYECPHCGRAYPAVKAIQEQLGDKLRFVFRNFPLAQLHPHAELAAETAEAAAAQGKFWEMHGALFEHQRAFELEDLVGYASQLGLDAKRIVHDLERRVHRARVEEDFISGARSGVNGTPTFFINGVRFDGDWNTELAAALTKLRS